MAMESNERWVCDKLLGQGGFGIVSLWRSEATDVRIAVKECRMKEEMPTKLWERWKMEVYIMGKLDHPNVIRAVEVPEQLKPKPGNPPVLPMEFCEGGDLRKVLNLAENTYGLKEIQIRQLASGIGSAIEYLHKNRIIHRDLKPENIVLKQGEENKTFYKIIDLGYAKELNITSMCDSFVGTVQYLAPELYVSKPYSKTVDYWSFGSLLFECICGFRPFIPSAPPVQWHAEVGKKSPEDITAQFDETQQNIQFSKKLPQPNQLCRPLQGYFEQWLRLMLRFDPKARGGGVMKVGEEERPKCFYVLEQMLSLHVLHILHVEANTVLSYPVNESHTIETVHLAVLQETEIPVEEQRIILANGLKLEPSALAIQGCCESNSEELIVFLFRRGTVKEDLRVRKPLPEAVQAIVKEPNIVLPAKDHRKTWAQAVYWFTEQHRNYKRLIQSHRAALLNLLRMNSDISKQKNQMVNGMGKIMACKDQFQYSLDFDINQYRDLLQGQPFDRIQVEKWIQTAQGLEMYNNLNEQVQEMDAKATALTTEIVELQRSPFGKSERRDELEEYVKKAQALYSELLKHRKEDKTDFMDHRQMVELVGKCYMERDRSTNTLYTHLGKVLDCMGRLEPILPSLTVICRDIESAQHQLLKMQTQRQAEIWAMLGHSINLVNSVGAGDMSKVSTQVSTPALALASPEYLPSWSSVTPSMESLQLLDDCKSMSQRLQGIVSNIMKEQEESMLYLSSLESNK